MNNYINYKHHLLAKNSEAYSILSAADKVTGLERKALLNKLDAHLREVDRRAQELIK